MQLRSSYTSLHQKVPPDAGLGHSNEAQGYSVGTEREGAVRSDTRERDSPIDSLRIFRQACPKEEQRLPELVDVTLATNGPQRFVLSGIECVDGCTYA
ncbi:hypothetical protein TOC8171_04080 [Pseudomonas syringae]